MKIAYSAASMLTKWEQIKRGERVVVNEEWHDAACDYFREHDGPDADLFFRDTATAPNPHRCGVYDGYIAYLVRQDIEA